MFTREGDVGVYRHIQSRGSGLGVKEDEPVCIPRENVNHNADMSIEVDRRVRNAWCSFQKYTLGLHDQPSAPHELKIRMLRAKVLEKSFTAVSRGARVRATTTRCAEPTKSS